MRKTCKILLGKPEGMRLLGRPRHSLHRWDDNIEVNFSAI
jgi:hypothetical protein